MGTWNFEYLGGEFPPLSVGSRSGTATFTRTGTSNFVTGEVNGEAGGEGYREQLTIGHDPGTHSLTVLERRPGGVDLLSVASWRSPIAISFVTSPVSADGRTYQLRRLLHVTSDTAFEVTEEFSIDGGPFRRLGSAEYSKRSSP